MTASQFSSLPLGTLRYNLPRPPVPWSSSGAAATTAKLHLIVPATSSNENFCRLLASAIALDYPAPVLVNWAAPENDDVFVQHLAKVIGSLQYLKSLPAEHDDDLLLMLDGFDVQLQLRPDLLIQRYYEVVHRSDQLLEQRLGKDVVRWHGLRNTVVFGADKACWPNGPSDPACWAVPQSPQDPHLYGPDTDTGIDGANNRPRWLNSGTILGPVKDVREILTQTARMIETEYVTGSDQYYMARLMGRQEYRRTLLSSGAPTQSSANVYVHTDVYGNGKYINVTYDMPQPAQLPQHDFHMTVDYEGALFQPVSGNILYIDWITYSSPAVSLAATSPSAVLTATTQDISFDLPADILASAPPFPSPPDSTNDATDATTTTPDTLPINLTPLPTDTTWRDLPLGTHTLNRRVFPLIHYTGPKALREAWWTHMWFFPHLESLIRAAARAPAAPYLITPHDGREWWPYRPVGRPWPHEVAQEGDAAAGKNKAPGSFDDHGLFLPWDWTCKAYEGIVFGHQAIAARPGSDIFGTLPNGG